MEQLGSLDAVFVYLESKALPLHMGAALIYDPSSAPGGSVGFDQILANLKLRMDANAVFRRRVERVPLDLDHPWWVDAGPVDLRHHVNRLALPAPADWREFCAQVARFLERPLDLTRPPWEMLFIEGLDGIDDMPDGAFALAMKMHHSAMDGVSGMEFIGCLHGQELVPMPPGPQAAVANRRPEAPSAVGLLLRALPNAAQHPARILNAVAGLRPALSRRVLGSQTDTESEPAAAVKLPHTRFNDSVGLHRAIGGVRFELADLKKIKNALPGATVNDAVLAVISGAVRQYLHDADELPTESLVALMPISQRDGDSEGLGNKLDFTTIPLGTDIDDPLERLRRLHETATKKKAAQKGEGAARLVQIANAVPAGLMGVAGRLALQLDLSDKVSGTNVSITNVPGPSAPLYMTGAKLVDIYGFAALANGLGLINMVASCGGSLTVGFQCGAARMPDPERYESCLRQSMAELISATAAPSQSGSHRNTDRKRDGRAHEGG
jgi:diacylglycerol O-acyltransferase / wax synthase